LSSPTGNDSIFALSIFGGIYRCSIVIKGGDTIKGQTKGGIVGQLFLSHIFAPQLFLGRSGAEQIGRQFRAAHVIKHLLPGFEPLALADVTYWILSSTDRLNHAGIWSVFNSNCLPSVISASQVCLPSLLSPELSKT